MGGERDLTFWLLFWAPAGVIVALLARHLFREQWGELRTLRFLTNALGPYFPEFDPPQLNLWIERCAPHVWHGWRARSFAGLSDFATPNCLSTAEGRFSSWAREGLSFEGRLERVLKIHFLDVRMEGDGPAPRDVVLRLRLEVLGTDALRGPDGALRGGHAEPTQLQQFWVLRHDGRQWRLDDARPARGELPRLPPAPPLPGLLDWKRPPGPGEDAGAMIATEKTGEK